MKILILGTGKTGTTAMVYKVGGGLPNCHVFSGGRFPAVAPVNMWAITKTQFINIPMKNAKVKASICTGNI
jgi:hypothetical protein